MARPAIHPRAFLDHRLRAVDAYLRSHLSDPKRLSLTSAARIANVSPEHLCRMFRERAWVSFVDWQCAVRTAEAKRLVVEEDAQLRAVARAVGYANESTLGVFSGGTKV